MSSPSSRAATSLAGTPDWVCRAADQAIAAHRRQPDPDRPLVCASGVSPSGPVHLGHLRELLTPHLVAEEIRRRGVPCDHLLFWDDYDRLRKIPKDVPASFADHLGRPLRDVPDPFGEHPSWAERFAAPVRAVLAELGLAVTEISQAERYRSGVYTEPVLRAMAARDTIRDVLASYRTGGGTGGEPYYPYRVYCSFCGRDTTAITSYDGGSTELSYRCASCGHRDTFPLAERGGAGKLVWKVDWPMRWAFEPVTYESAGADHASPGSSVTVGQRLCREVFGAEPPVFVGFSFVGIRGMAKLSSSAGGVPTPGDALAVLEPPLLRWLYARRRPQQSITIDLGPDLTRLYDEWDRLTTRATTDPATGSAGGGPAPEAAVYRRAAWTSDAGWLPRPAVVVPWRLLGSAVDITAGDDTQLLRVLRDAGTGVTDLAEVEPRLARARAWVAALPAGDRTRVRDEPATDLLAGLAEQDRAGLAMLLDGLADRWSLDGLTALVYGVPKRLRGLAEDAPADADLKQAQRAFFALLYRLLVDADTGPRLPTLLLALGQDRLRRLLTVPSSTVAG